jgi:hypothetical protein
VRGKLQKDTASPTFKRQMSLLRACAADRMAPGTPLHAEPLSLDLVLIARYRTPLSLYPVGVFTSEAWAARGGHRLFVCCPTPAHLSGQVSGVP